MLKVGDYVTLKKGLVLGKKYGTVTFGLRHSQYNGMLLKIVKISSTGTAYCTHSGYACECGTIHESMLDTAKFKEGDRVHTWNLRTTSTGYTIGMIQYADQEATIEKVKMGEDGFAYLLNIDEGFNLWPERALSNEDSLLEDLKDSLDNENRLQKQETPIRNGEGIKGSRVLGRLGKTSIRSRPLRNPQRVRGK